MSTILNIVSSIDEAELIEAIVTGLSRDELIEFVKQLEQHVACCEFTKELSDYFKDALKECED